MRPIPLSLRKKIAANPFMAKCVYPGCSDKPEWEHALTYAGKQINEEWAIIPVCIYHHRGEGFNKSFNRWVAISRTRLSDFVEYPKFDWMQLKIYLHSIFEGRYEIEEILKFDKYMETL